MQKFSAQFESSDDWFIQRLMPVQSRLYGYIASLVPARTDAEDLFQKTTLTAWQHRRDYDPERDFFAWACGIARNHVRHHFRDLQKTRVVLSSEVVDQMTARVCSNDETLLHRHRALAGCLEKLPDAQRSLIERFYASEKSVRQFATQQSESLEAIYKQLQRIRFALGDCIERTLSREGA
ncbi:sigma-70 family RNA polymerase sigma factor [Calycomorphotria hydatis]|uniref:RNA polymerase sigma factor n=1 Tax=Calycomorphotria hydatis TaxID=2528027 RepID=A0A517TAS6_9PLAN|nr:sigma-70 family RNA polymerase sigma factor [Calycomorphotria hydatis]QDT65472.1 RNA polymerase sigma factor [Calycomorphotria hydatis]